MGRLQLGPRAVCGEHLGRVARFFKERRLEPQITIGLLTDATGFPLQVEAFEGNKAETATVLPTIEKFKTAHALTDVTIVADAGMVSEANRKAIEAAGLSFFLVATEFPTACGSGRAGAVHWRVLP